MAIVKREVKKKFYSVLKEVGASDKCPPQARLIVDTIKTAGGRVEREELLTLLRRPVDQGGLKTNQTAERILGFYRPKLTALGVLKEDVEVETIEEEVPDEPAKVATPAADAAGAASAAPVPDNVKGAKGKKKAA
jgi:hypothetical protein